MRRRGGSCRPKGAERECGDREQSESTSPGGHQKLAFCRKPAAGAPTILEESVEGVGAEPKYHRRGNSEPALAGTVSLSSLCGDSASALPRPSQPEREDRPGFEARQGETSLSAFVFHRTGCPLGNFARAWAAACKAANVQGRLFHDLRRTAVRDMIRAGVPQAVAKKISGHETDSVLERYNIVSEEDKLNALRRRQSYLDAREEKHNVVALRAANSDKDSDK